MLRSPALVSILAPRSYWLSLHFYTSSMPQNHLLAWTQKLVKSRCSFFVVIFWGFSSRFQLSSFKNSLLVVLLRWLSAVETKLVKSRCFDEIFFTVSRTHLLLLRCFAETVEFQFNAEFSLLFCSATFSATIHEVVTQPTSSISDFRKCQSFI